MKTKQRIYEKECKDIPSTNNNNNKYLFQVVIYTTYKLIIFSLFYQALSVECEQLYRI